MTSVGFLIFFGLSFVLLPCDGGIVSPVDGTNYTFLPGSTGNLTWTFDDEISSLIIRGWHFIPGGGSKAELLATISKNDNPQVQQSSLSGVEIVKPATLLLKNVSQSYNGIYRFSMVGSKLVYPVSVRVFIANAVSPTVISFASAPENAVFGESVVLGCEAIAVPIPSYTIIHNNTEIVSTQKSYIITALTYSNAGPYKCIATNHLGNSSKTFSLSIADPSLVISFAETRMTDSPTTKHFRTTTHFRTGKVSFQKCSCTGKTKWYLVMVPSMSGIIFGILLSYLVSCSCRKLRSRDSQSNSKQTEVDPTYQELDLTNMNTEDNAGNDDDSTYTNLNKTRDAENIYQSLT